MSNPQFWSTPLRYLRWASHEKPAFFYSIVVGSLGPVFLVGLPPIRRYFGDVDPEPIPMTYPGENIPICHFSCQLLFGYMPDSIDMTKALTFTLPSVPKGPRIIPKGFDDE
jgi:hypothetical protein